jgi:hypothetical protein
MTFPSLVFSSAAAGFIRRAASIRQVAGLSLAALAGLAAFGPRASATTFVNFADPGTPVLLTGFFQVDGGATNYITGTNPAELADGGIASFNGTALGGTPNFGFNFTLYDDGILTTTPELISQASFYLSNYSGAKITVAANGLRFGVSGLYALDGQTLDAVFNYTYISEGAGVVAAGWVPHYDAVMGEFYFTNADAFEISNQTILIFNGNFTTSVVPEPSTCALFLGGATMGFALWRRRRVG